MEYSECLPARLNPLAERTCFYEVGDGTTREVCAHPLEAIEGVTVSGGDWATGHDHDTATFSIDPDSDPWGPDSIDNGVRARRGRLSGLSVFHSKPSLCSVCVWPRRALNGPKRLWFSGAGRTAKIWCLSPPRPTW
jgi:hypothetical protein